jgi:hypothetical protein
MGGVSSVLDPGEHEKISPKKCATPAGPFSTAVDVCSTLVARRRGVVDFRTAPVTPAFSPLQEKAGTRLPLFGGRRAATGRTVLVHTTRRTMCVGRIFFPRLRRAPNAVATFSKAIPTFLKPTRFFLRLFNSFQPAPTLLTAIQFCSKVAATLLNVPNVAARPTDVLYRLNARR